MFATNQISKFMLVVAPLQAMLHNEHVIYSRQIEQTLINTQTNGSDIYLKFVTEHLTLA